MVVRAGEEAEVGLERASSVSVAIVLPDEEAPTYSVQVT